MAKVTDIDNAPIVQAVQPNSRKLGDISHYSDAFLVFGGTMSRIKVVREVILDHNEFSHFTQNLMSHFDWLDGMGGTSSEYVSKYEGDEQIFEKLLRDRPEFEAFKAQAYNEVVKVSHADTDLFIYVDPQGYDYARYIMFPPDRGIGRMMAAILAALPPDFWKRLHDNI